MFSSSKWNDTVIASVYHYGKSATHGHKMSGLKALYEDEEEGAWSSVVRWDESYSSS